MPPAARISDNHTCPKVEPGPVPHVGGPIITGESTVLIGFMPAAREGDTAICIGPPDSIKKGEPTVIIGNKPAARLGDPTNHGGVIVMGCPTVIIGSSTQSLTLKAASDEGTPFCEECAKRAAAQAKAAEASEASKPQSLDVADMAPAAAASVASAAAKAAPQVSALKSAAKQGAAFCKVCGDSGAAE